ncbi:MAG TPA: response regulator [Gemmatimonadales bacterium]|nr:response regulator [Gemmatimonadales bacterium]
MSNPLRLLLVEDSEADAELLALELRRAGFALEFERVDSAAALGAALDRATWDLIISDNSMPGFSGTEALAQLRSRDLDIPFIFVSGTMGEDLAARALDAGAGDALEKGNLRRLLPVIRRELREFGERRARRESEASYSALVEQAPLGIYRSTPAGRFLSANAALARILGYDSPAELLTLDMARDVYADPDERRRLVEHDTYTDKVYDELEATWKKKDGTRIRVQLSVRASRDTDGRVAFYEAFVRDITTQRQLEAQLAQAQKMEAIGRLAGGVAHDFNNLLTVILSYSDLLLEDLPKGSATGEDIGQIRKAAQGASELTRQLLAFSRQQVLQPKVVDLNAAVSGIERLLGRVLREDIQLRCTLAADAGTVRVDPGQLEQVLMNLAVNARDAMPQGGQLTIETANVDLDEAYMRAHPVAAPGSYVMLAVTDTGMGMDAATQARIFEPFFTTKDVGKGTGLGLATVQGIVQQSGGFIWVYSEPSHGTCFKVYLPRVDEPVSTAANVPIESTRGTETVLVVEDVAAVRAVSRKMLERYGYRVLDAGDGDVAVRVADESGEHIHLLLTDVVMPNVNGRDLAALFAKTRPTTKVLFMSGYTDDAIVRHGILQEGIAYLQKPFTPESLARKVRAVLDAGAARSACVLLIDDHEDVRVSLRRMLEDAGHRVLDAADGKTGVGLLGGTKVDVVITDLFMPGQDGIVTIRRIRKEYPAVKIIAMSGGGLGGQLGLLKDAVLLGATTALRKPIGSKELLEAIRTTLG